jgi:SPP1 family predicted phage head-tail adaptor
MIIGKSDRRITIERATETTNGYGEKVATWATLITVWAELTKTTNARESISDRQDTATKQLAFKIRSSTDSRAVSTKDRVVYDSKHFDIIGIEEIGRNDQLMLTCQLNDTTYAS